MKNKNQSFTRVLEGQLSIHRQSGSDSEDLISIEVVDKSSGCQAFEVKVSLKEMMNALTGFGYRPCEYDLNVSGVIGKTREHKTEIVSVPDARGEYGSPARRAVMREALKPFEVDGWRGSPEDLENHHRWVKGSGGKKAEVGFFRYV